MNLVFWRLGVVGFYEIHICKHAMPYVAGAVE